MAVKYTPEQMRALRAFVRAWQPGLSRRDVDRAVRTLTLPAASQPETTRPVPGKQNARKSKGRAKSNR